MYEDDKSKVCIVLSAICSVLLAAMVFFCIKYFFTMELSEDHIDTDTFLLFSDRSYHIVSSILMADSFDIGFKHFFKLLLVGLSGTLAWVINYAFSELPINLPKKDYLIKMKLTIVDKVIYGIMLLIPGILNGINLGISLFFHGKEFINQNNFNLLFKNYNAFMAISQIVYIFVCLCLVFLIFESVISSGIMGSLIRIPLMLVSNFSMMLAVCVLVYYAFVAAMIILAIIIGLAILSAWSRPKVYVKW